MAALNFGNIAAGTEGFYAGMDLASRRRQTERTEERDVMALEALRRQEALRQQQVNAPAPETVTTGDLLGVGQQQRMDVEQIAPPAAPLHLHRLGQINSLGQFLQRHDRL